MSVLCLSGSVGKPSTILFTALSLSAAMRPLELSAYREPGCSGCEGGDGGGEGGEGGEGGANGGEGGEGDLEVKQTLKPPLTTVPSDDQLSAEASTPSGPFVPE